MAINKPLTIARQEFIDSVIDLCNNSNLPYFCMESIIKDILSEIHQASVKQYEMDKNNYEAELKSVSDENERMEQREGAK